MAAAVALLPAAAAVAQNLVITNARILTGTGDVIESGSVVVRDGRIASVSEGNANANGAQVIDAAGKTVMPGYIEGHRHVIEGNGQQWLNQRAAAQMQEFLEAGFTTVVSQIDAPQLLDARRRIEAGEMPGPRLFAATMIPLAGQAPGAGMPPGDPARHDPTRFGRPEQTAPAIPREATLQAIESAVEAGYDYIKTLLLTTPNGPELDTLKFIIEEGNKRGIPTVTHAVSVVDTLLAVEAGPASLVHTPHIGRIDRDPEAVQKIVDAGIPMMSTLSVFIPHFDEENTPLFRDREEFPWETLESGAHGPLNARFLWNAGIVAYGYGTDTQWAPKESLMDEIRALNSVFSTQDIVRILTHDSAAAILKEDELGTLEPGKLADIVIIDGNPLARSADLLNVVATIKGGEVVFEK